jgi:hypothetical protein
MTSPLHFLSDVGAPCVSYESNIDSIPTSPNATIAKTKAKIATVSKDNRISNTTHNIIRVVGETYFR